MSSASLFTTYIKNKSLSYDILKQAMGETMEFFPLSKVSSPEDKSKVISALLQGKGNSLYNLTGRLPSNLPGKH